MYGNFNVPTPRNLEEKLEQTGRLWWVEKMFAGTERSDFELSGFASALTQDIYRQIATWAITDAPLQATTLQEVRALVADYAVRYHNIDLDGRTVSLPKNRAQEVQSVK